MLRILAIPLALVAFHGYESSVKPLPAPLERSLDGRFWQSGCPVALTDLRLLTVTHWGFDGREHTGQLVVNRDSARELATVFKKLHALEFPIRHLRLDDMYGPKRARPADGDISGSFHCRRAVPSPCGSGSGNWSNHAYGHAIDLNPNENPYAGCGAVYDPRSRPYVDRSRLRKGMITPAVVRAFASIGWGWGGAWTGDTKDYMHFSTTGS
ncbi:MAG TPA: M15 family metallopeptidase [Gaiellaceae bacterium]